MDFAESSPRDRIAQAERRKALQEVRTELEDLQARHRALVEEAGMTRRLKKTKKALDKKFAQLEKMERTLDARQGV